MQLVQAKASAAALAARTPRTIAVLAYATPAGDYLRVVPLHVPMPEKGSAEYASIEADAARMQARMFSIPAGIEGERQLAHTRMPSPNDPCWCGSGKRYKKCHRV